MLYPETLGSGVSEQERGLWLLLGLFVWFSFVVWGLVCLFGGGFFGVFFLVVVCLFVFFTFLLCIHVRKG